ncbi:BA75_01431T0 [Komagataella pastoris]|uniref:BA75_01431T0 n=1 Tax=Komagataella pastoris TaxID=4922 RepID=A0A1B2J9I7_PICPA|nr:BA75_01431T0 [Komagataella pastoris]
MDLRSVIDLVEALYAPNDPSSIVLIQKQLQDVQRSENGWLIADSLLEQESINCQFFGALTYTVNLYLHRESLTKNEDGISYETVTQKLLFHIDSICKNPNYSSKQLVVLKKLMSNLAIIYINTYQQWQDPVGTLRMTLYNNSETPIGNEFYDYLTLLFTTLLLEEIHRKLTIDLTDSTEFHKSIHSHLYPYIGSLVQGFQNTTNETIIIQWLSLLAALVQYITQAEIQSTIRYGSLGELFSPLFDFATGRSIEISNKTIEVITLILDTNPSIFPAEINAQLEQLIFAGWGENYLGHLLQDKDLNEDAISKYAMMINSFIEPQLLRLLHQLGTNTNDASRKLDCLVELSTVLCKEFIFFWNQLADIYLDEEDILKQKPTWSETQSKVQTILSKLAEIYWRDCHISGDFDYDDEDEMQDFVSYRRDIADFYETVYPILKMPLFEHLVSNIVSNLSTPNNNSLQTIADIESSLFLIQTLACNFNEDNATSEIYSLLKSLLDSGLFETVIQSNNKLLVKTCIQFLTSMDFFYSSQLGEPYLESTLRFLLSTPNEHQIIASKAISSICNDCRISLAPVLPTFKLLIDQIVVDPEVKPIIRERIIYSYSSIVQGIRSPSDQANLIHSLLNGIISKAIKVQSEPKLIDYLQSLLSSIEEIGKAMRLPSDVNDWYTPEERDAVYAYWIEDPLHIKKQITEVVRQFMILNPLTSENYLINEICTGILKAGLTEAIPGPFVFDTYTIIEFLNAKISQCFSKNSLNVVPLQYSLLESLIKSSSIGSNLLTTTLQQSCVEYLSIIQQDPDLALCFLNILVVILEKKPGILIKGCLLHNILPFVLDSLGSKEKFVLRSGCKFWIKLVTLRKGDKEDSVIIRDMVEHTELGPSLIFKLVASFLMASRSDLENFMEVFKVILVKYPLNFKKWFNLAFETINNNHILKKQIPTSDTVRLGQQLMLTRGSRKVNDLLKKFWLQVNELIEYS